MEQIDVLRPDLLFLDIKMPVLTGLEVLDRISYGPHVVFTTAFDRYAATAFELQALDYLVKPFSRERLKKTLERIGSETGNELRETDTAARMRSALNEPRLSRIFVRSGGRIVPVKTSEIRRIEARDDYVALYAEVHRHLVQITMTSLAERLDPEIFVRVHRSHMVNFDHVVSLDPYDGSRLRIKLDDGSTVMASRARSQERRHRVL